MSKDNMSGSNVDISMGQMYSDNITPTDMGPSLKDNQVDRPVSAPTINDYIYKPPNRYQAYRAFLCSIICETFCYIIWPIVYGLYLFEAVGKQERPEYDCYASWHDKRALPGIMNIDDDKWINVSQ